MPRGLLRQATQRVRTSMQNIDSGAGATADEVLMVPAKGVYLLAARIVYEDVTSGTDAAASYALGTTVGGADIAAATNLENAKAVGTTTALALLKGYIPANTMICSRYTGVAITVVGQCHLELEYAVAE